MRRRSESTRGFCQEVPQVSKLQPSLLKELINRQTGAVTYFYITDDGWLQPGECPNIRVDLTPELEYTYDMKLPAQDDPEYIRPKPHDDEVQSFAVRIT